MLEGASSRTQATQATSEQPAAGAPESYGPSPGRAFATGFTWAALLIASYLFRLPPLLNARSTNSDAAVVGLQAMHLLRGEHSAFLWGSGYQTSADSYVAALFFAIFGATPLVLMLSALTLHVGATALVFATLRRRLEPWTAFVLTLPLVVAPSSIHTYALYPPRQLSITLAVASFWAIHGASKRSGAPARFWLASGGALYTLSISADPYPMVLAPVLLAYAALVAWPRPLERFLPLVTGLFTGLLPFVMLRQAPRASAGQLGLTTSVIGHNWELLVRECLPWALSYKVYFAHNVMNYRPWNAPFLVWCIGVAGAVVSFAIVAIALASVRKDIIPRSSRLLGFFGAASWVVTLSAFLVSVMVMDHFSMRYLAVLTLMLPFAAAPIAHLLGRGRVAALLAPHLVASAIGGWVGYGPFVHGIVPVRETPELRDDYALLTLLEERNITVAEADYWASYRLTLLFREKVTVVPTNLSEDRYPPYRKVFDASPTFAYVFDPNRSREDLNVAERALGEANAAVEKTAAGGLTVFLVTRKR